MAIVSMLGHISIRSKHLTKIGVLSEYFTLTPTRNPLQLAEPDLITTSMTY